ncbi:MAG: ABC transporter permease [Planctomycetota bacterium]|nr:ABC transporter permease [Planctomycetota bacterium]
MTKQTVRETSPQAEISKFQLKAGKRVLLENASAFFAKGKITLIVGPSGVGKSLLLKILSGILDTCRDGIFFQGHVEIEGSKAIAGQSAVVFQNFALFDEFSPNANVNFAVAHRTDQGTKIRSSQILKQLDVPTNVPTSRLSGGQRQRLAIARALAYGKPTIFFDEPTAGLDIGNAEKVAALIKKTSVDHGTTAIIVTHDYQSLTPIADEIYFLDPTTRTLDAVDQSDWPSLHHRLKNLSDTSTRAQDEQALLNPGAFESFKKGMCHFAEGTTRCIEAVALLPWRLVPAWRSPVWGGKFFLHYLNLITGLTAIAYLMVAGLILGFVTMYFTFEYMPFPQFSRPLIIEDVLAAVGFGLYRIVIPVIGTVLIAARCGSAVTADIGSKEYGQQLDAMRSLSARPNQYLLTNILFSFLIGVPLLIFVSFQTARWISLIVFLSLNPNVSPDFWHQYFHRNLESPEAFYYIGTGWVLTKILICGLGIGLIAYAIGRQPKFSSNDVSSSVTRTTLYSTIFVLAVHFVFAFFEFNRLE